VKLQITRLSLLALLTSMLVVPAMADSILYNNGAPCPGGCIDAWTISLPFAVTDNFTLVGNATLTGVDFAVWVFPTDTPRSVDWELGNSAFGANIGVGTASNLEVTFLGLNEYGFNLDEVSFSLPNINLGAGTYWLTLQNASVGNPDPVYWDENSGSDCTSPGCPSQAYSNEVGSIPSESFDIRGNYNSSTPEPGSVILFSSGVLALGGVVRRLMF
jgi:hypothetical protein